MKKHRLWGISALVILAFASCSSVSERTIAVGRDAFPNAFFLGVTTDRYEDPAFRKYLARKVNEGLTSLESFFRTVKFRGASWNERDAIHEYLRELRLNDKRVYREFYVEFNRKYGRTLISKYVRRYLVTRPSWKTMRSFFYGTLWGKEGRTQGVTLGSMFPLEGLVYTKQGRSFFTDLAHKSLQISAGNIGARLFELLLQTESDPELWYHTKFSLAFAYYKSLDRQSLEKMGRDESQNFGQRRVQVGKDRFTLSEYIDALLLAQLEHRSKRDETKQTEKDVSLVLFSGQEQTQSAFRMNFSKYLATLKKPLPQSFLINAVNDAATSTRFSAIPVAQAAIRLMVAHKYDSPDVLMCLGRTMQKKQHKAPQAGFSKVAKAARLALMSWGPRVFDVFVPMLHRNPTKEERSVVAYVLGEVGATVEMSPKLRQMLQDPKVLGRRRHAKPSNDLGVKTVSAVQMLEQILRKESDKKVRATIVDALRKIRRF